MLDLVGLKSEHAFDGTSFAAVLRGEKDKHRDYAYAAHNNIPEGPAYPIRSITDGEWRYIRNLTPDEIFIEKHLMGLLGGSAAHNPYWSSWMATAWRWPRTAHRRAPAGRRRPPRARTTPPASSSTSGTSARCRCRSAIRRAAAIVERTLGNVKLTLAPDNDSRFTLVANSLSLPKAEDPLGLTRAQFEADPRSVDPVAVSFNTLKLGIAEAASSIDDAREGLISARDQVEQTNRDLEQRVDELHIALEQRRIFLWSAGVGEAYVTLHLLHLGFRQHPLGYPTWLRTEAESAISLFLTTLRACYEYQEGGSADRCVNALEMLARAGAALAPGRQEPPRRVELDDAARTLAG